MRQAEHADHDAPLDLGVALQEAVRVTGHRADHRDGQEGVDGDEDREQVKVPVAHQQILQRQHGEEGQDQAAVVAAPGGQQSDVFAQSQEGQHSKQQRCAHCARHPCQPEHRGADPHCSQVAVQARLPRRQRLAALTQAQCGSHQAGQQERAEQGHEEQADLAIGVEIAQGVHLTHSLLHQCQDRHQLQHGLQHLPAAWPPPLRGHDPGMHACLRPATG